MDYELKVVVAQGTGLKTQDSCLLNVAHELKQNYKATGQINKIHTEPEFGRAGFNSNFHESGYKTRELALDFRTFWLPASKMSFSTHWDAG